MDTLVVKLLRRRRPRLRLIICFVLAGASKAHGQLKWMLH